MCAFTHFIKLLLVGQTDAEQSLLNKMEI